MHLGYVISGNWWIWNACWMQMAAVAALCVQYEADFRPNMSIVVKALQPLLNTRAGPTGESGLTWKTRTKLVNHDKSSTSIYIFGSRFWWRNCCGNRNFLVLLLLLWLFKILQWEACIYFIVIILLNVHVRVSSRLCIILTSIFDILSRWFSQESDTTCIPFSYFCKCKQINALYYKFQWIPLYYYIYQK